MQSCRSLTKSRKARRGFTLIELLVVISIIAVLMSLILPAVQNAREAGRRTQCLNNIRNVTLAALNFASGNKSRLPALGYFPQNPVSAGRIEGRSWVIELLPYMDQQATYDRWNKDVAFDVAPNLNLAQDLYVEALACPNDESAFQVGGGLSYVANTGFGDPANGRDNVNGAVQHSPIAEPLNWNAPGGNTISNGPTQPTTTTPASGEWNADPVDTGITQATGVFWPEFGNVSSTRNTSATIGKIYDGSGNTLMFGENTNAVGSTNFADPKTRAVGFWFPVTAALLVAPADLNNMVPAMTVGAPAFPNEAKTGPDGERPFLNSNHPSIVVVSMCDGSARTISEDVDESVYTRLLTPSATRLRAGVGTVETPLSGDDF